MSELVPVALLACALALGTGALLVRPGRRAPAVLRGVLAAVLAASSACLAGAATGFESTGFLLSAALAAAPVSLALSAALAAGGVDRRHAALVVGGWALLGMPAGLLAPAAIAAVSGPDNRIEDFGAVLAVVVATSAAVLAGLPRAEDSARTRECVADAPPRSMPGGHLPAALALWIAAVGWLVSLEGAIDPYTARILVSSFLGPVGGLVAWGAVLVGRGRSPLSPRTVLGGLGMGLMAVLAGLAALAPEWALVTGALGGAVGAGIVGVGTRRMSVRRGAIAALVVAAIGLLAPAVVGEGTGFVFSGRIAALAPPVAGAVLVACGAFCVLRLLAGFSRLRPERR